MALASGLAPTHAEADFDVRSEAWDGLGALVRLARARGVSPVSPDEIDATQLRPEDALLIVHPRERLPVADLSRFMRHGGRIALADDRGRGEELLNAFKIGRHEIRHAQAYPRVRGRSNLLIAQPVGTHALTAGVRALVTNHPRVVHHAQLEPVFAFGDDHGAVVLAGAIGKGRFVAVSDSSVLINNMLQFRGNRRFARNLIDYLQPEPGATLFVANAATLIVGRPGAGRLRPLDGVKEGLRTVAAADLPPAALSLSSLVIVVVLWLAAASALPRRSPYAHSAVLRARPPLAGYAGRVRFFSRRRDLLQPLLTYRFELEAALSRALGARRPGARRDDLVAAVRGAGLPASDVQQLQALLEELQRIQREHERGAAPRISARKFHRHVASGDRILRELRATPAAGT